MDYFDDEAALFFLELLVLIAVTLGVAWAM